MQICWPARGIGNLLEVVARGATCVASKAARSLRWQVGLIKVQSSIHANGLNGNAPLYTLEQLRIAILLHDEHETNKVHVPPMVIPRTTLTKPQLNRGEMCRSNGLVQLT